MNLSAANGKAAKHKGSFSTKPPPDLLSQIAGGETRNLKKEYQFFETPNSVADRLVELANIGDNDTILEPSTGRGAIVKAVHRRHPYRAVCGYELMEQNHSFLEKIENFELLGKDFLSECDCLFDIVIANPPFAKNQDIDHIRHMFDKLYPGGRLVSVASIHWRDASGKKETLFRQWLEDKGAEIHTIDRGTFKESGTMIECCIVVITK